MSFLRNQKRPTASAQSSRESGSALIAVLLALALLFSLGVPFLMTSRLRSESSRQSFDRVQAQIAVSSASDYAILIQGASHPAADATPLYDSSTEWDATHDDPLPQSLGDAWADTPESWGLEVESLQSRVSLASASPLLLQNLLHPCFLTSDATHDSDSLRVNSTAGFPESGLLFVNGEWVQYGSISAQAFLELVPAENAPDDTSSKRFRSGTALLDPRVWYLALSRFQEGHFETPEFFDDAFAFDFDDEAIELFPEQDRQLLADRTWLSTGSFGSPLWMPPEWLTREVSADNPDILFVSDANAFAPGTVIRIQPEVGDPFDTIVLAVESNMGVLRIANPAPLDLLSWRTRVYPMRREPVDLNAAHPDILAALVTGVRFRNAPSMVIDIPPTGSPTSDWVSPSQAQQFAQRVIDSRPLTGPEDLWLRVLRPMAVANELTDYEAWAVWLNGMDSSHGLLSQSTTGFAYRSGERYLTRVEAAVRSRLGNTLSRYRRILQTFAAPAGLLLQMWQSQETFEDLARWSRGMHRVVSFPSNVGHLQTSDNSDSPTALTLQLGTFSEIGRMSPEGDLELSSIRPETVRDQPIEGSGVIGEVEHFDFETHPFGRDLASRGPIRTTAADWSIDDSNGFSSTQPIHLQGWFEMPPGLGDATLFDLSGLEIDRQRVSMGIQQGMLKLRVFDNAGDDPGDEDNIVQAVEWSLDPAEYALSDRWVHLAVLLRTAHPRGAQLAVDGIPRGTSNCLTWLTQQSASWAPGDPDGILAVESTNGFPSRGVLKVGEELMEYSSKTETSFDLARSLAPNAHIGGRAARESSDTAMGIVDSTHPSGAGVELYGYSALLESDIPPGLGQLDGTMGPWSVATAVEGEDTIDVMLLSGDTLTLGDGIEGGYIGPIELAVMEVGDPHYLEAFQSKGGYALIFQSWFRDGSGEVWRDKDGFMIGGFEIVRYSERTDTGIVLSERAVQSPGTAAADVPDYAFDDEGSSFITDWEPGFGEALGQAFEDDPLYRVFIMPISVKGTGVFDVSYLNPTVEFSEFVQVAPFGDAGKTEWVRYDSIFNGNFMRDHWGALSSAVFHLLREVGANIPQDPSAIPISGLSADASTPQVTIRTPAASQSAAWDVFTHTLGEREPTRDLVIEEIRRQFDFRGVLGTFDHYQEQESDLIPVFRTTRAAMDSSSGYVGRLDRVAVMQPPAATTGGSNVAPDWFTVQWGAAPSLAQTDTRVRSNVTYVAFDKPPMMPYLATDLSTWDPMAPDFDMRTYARLCKFPSGERPADLDTLVVGQDVASTSIPFAGMVDELSVHTVGGMGTPSAMFARGSFVLDQELSDLEERRLALNLNKLNVDGRIYWATVAGMFSSLLKSSGIIDIDGERVAYYRVEVDSTAIWLYLSPEGRGLHGTERRSHDNNTTVWVVDGRAASALDSDLEAQGSEFRLESDAGFAEYGAILIGDELLHAPMRSMSGDFLMPRLRAAPQSEEDYGAGALRGRFGTAPANHAMGEMAYAWPTRFADLYTPQCDSPASAYFQFGLEDPNAHWRSLLFDAELRDASQQVFLLARSGQTDWEADPFLTPGLRLFDQGHLPGGDPMPLRFTADSAEFRVMFDWGPGAFDPIEFRSTGWTTAPRLRSLLIDSIAEPRIESFQEVHP